MRPNTRLSTKARVNPGDDSASAPARRRQSHGKDQAEDTTSRRRKQSNIDEESCQEGELITEIPPTPC